MRSRMAFWLPVLSVAILLAWAAPLRATEPGPPPGLIPVDVDPFFKGLTGETAYAQIEADKAAVAAQLAQSVESSAATGGALAGVGDVEFLYADGWREFTLRALADNAEIWVANDLSYCPGDPRPADVVTQTQIDYLLAEFNNNIYLSDTTHFGYTDDRYGTAGLFALLGYSWYQTTNPQRVMVLVYNIEDDSWCDPDYPFFVAGYYWSTMNVDYADRNIIHIDTYNWAERMGPDGPYAYGYEGTIAHELEHAIHYDHDADELSWVDEGLADLAEFLAGYGHPSSHLAYYLAFHRTPLTQWGGGLEDYGESYLLQLYLLESFGGATFIRALVDEQANGIAGIENQLAAFSIAASFDEIYRDWTLANYLDDLSQNGISGGPLGYAGLEIPSEDTWGYSIPWSIENIYGSDNHGNLPIARYWGGYKSGTVQYPIGTLPPYTPMYLTYKGYQPQLVSTFQAPATFGVSAHSGSYLIWGGIGDLVFNTATSPVTLPAGSPTLSFWTWYEIEEFWDFGFVQVSADGGSTWTSLENAHTTYEHDPSAHPDIVNNLPGFTGSSGDWTQESFDLSAYAGMSVQIRFVYATDWATTESGFYVDDVEISGLPLEDFESGLGGWALNGWVHTTGLVGNDWELAFVNPVYERGKFVSYEILEDSMFLYGDFLLDLTTVDTLGLNRDLVTVVLSNHLPEPWTVESGYLLLIEKGTADGN